MNPSYVTEPMQRWRRWTDGPLLILAIGSLPLLLVELKRDQLTGGERAILTVTNAAESPDSSPWSSASPRSP